MTNYVSYQAKCLLLVFMWLHMGADSLLSSTDWFSTAQRFRSLFRAEISREVCEGDKNPSSAGTLASIAENDLRIKKTTTASTLCHPTNGVNLNERRTEISI